MIGRASRIWSLQSLLIVAILGVCIAEYGCQGRSSSATAPTPFSVASGSTLNTILDRKKLIVGMEVEFWPFEYDDGKGNPVGFDVDLARELAEALGVELELRDTEWAGIIASLINGKVDIVMSGMTATLERARTIAFSEPYYHTGLCLLIHNGSTVRSVDDLNVASVKLALKTGTTGHLVSEERFPKAAKLFFKDEAACALAVAQGKADAFVYDQVSVARHAKTYPKQTRANLKPFTKEPYAIAMRQGDAVLARYVDQFVRTVRDDGRLAALVAKHLQAISDD